jgi:hypothetical protein
LCSATRDEKKKPGQYSVRIIIIIIFGVATLHSERHFSSPRCSAELSKPERGQLVEAI